MRTIHIRLVFRSVTSETGIMIPHRTVIHPWNRFRKPAVAQRVKKFTPYGKLSAQGTILDFRGQNPACCRYTSGD